MDLSGIDARMRRWIGVGARVALGRVALKRSFGNAERYIAWLDAGNVGRHWEMEQ